MNSNHYLPTDKMRNVVADNPMLLMALSRFGISLGFGDDTIEEVCNNAGVDTPTFLAVASVISNKKPESAASISLESLITYLKKAHSYFIDFYLPTIRRNLISAINCAGGEAVALVILKFYDDYVAEVKKHMEYENTHVFTYVDSLLAGKSSEDYSIEKFRSTHAPIATKLHELKDIFICHYHGAAADNDRLNAVLFDIMNCETDLLSHCEVENSLLVPAVMELEKKVRLTSVATVDEADDNKVEKESADPSVHNLTEREKEIIRNIARGLSNKEIADRLFLSVYTVATHRRNICAKLDIHSAAGLTIFAIIHKLLDISEVKAQ